MRSVRRITCGLAVGTLFLATPALRPSPASAYAGGGFTHVGNAVQVGADGPQAVVSGDFNSDGNSDLAVAEYDGGFDVLLSHPDGQLTPVTASLPQFDNMRVTQLAVGQFTNDDIPDLVAIGFRGDNSSSVEVLAGDGTGGFTEMSVTNVGDTSGSYSGENRLAVADLNGDDHDDVVVTNGTIGEFQVLLGDGSGNLTEGTGAYTVSREIKALAVADVNGDGHKDVLVLTDCRSTECDSGGLAVWLGDGHGGFAETSHSPFGTAIITPDTASVIDVNYDGRPDVVASNGQDASIMLNDGSGSFNVAPGSRLIANGGPVAAGYDPALHDVFLAGVNLSGRLKLFLTDHSGTLTELPDSPITVPQFPSDPNDTQLTAGTIDGIPVLFIAAAEWHSPTVVNVMADAIRYSATPPPNNHLAAPSAFALFNDPGNTPTAIRDYESTLIQGAGEIAHDDGGPPEIRASFYRLTDTNLAQDLVDAANDGARVQVLLDAGNRTVGCRGVAGCRNPSYLILKQLNSVGGGGWLKTCDGIGPGHPNAPVGRGHGCVAQAGNHNKFLMVSQTYDPRTTPGRFWLFGQRTSNVVVQTSSNNTIPQYKTALNNALVTMNQPAVYNDYVNYFNRLAASYAAKRPPSVKHFAASFGYRADTMTVSTHAISTWSFPRVGGNDPLLNMLNLIRTGSSCRNNTAHAAGPARNGVAVAMSHIGGRIAVIQRLAQLRRSGCKVQIAYAAISVPDRRILARAGVGLHRLCLSGPGRRGSAEFLHSKYVLVAGDYRGLGPNRRVVYTGSENLDRGALTRSDDRMERYVEPASRSPIFDAYLANFSHLVDLSQYSASSPQTCTTD